LLANIKIKWAESLVAALGERLVLKTGDVRQRPCSMIEVLRDILKVQK
jgi:hypothetical protein